MRYAELQRWAFKHHRIRLSSDGNGKSLDRILRSEHPGSGCQLVYGVRERRRVAVWARWRRLGMSDMILRGLLAASDGHGDGWVVTSAGETCWTSDPTTELEGLLIAGFSAVRCGQ